MKRAVIAIFCLSALSLHLSMAQTYINAGLMSEVSAEAPEENAKNGDEAVSAIVECFSRGDAEALSQWFDDNLEMSIFMDSNIASKVQAKQIMKAFFKDNEPKSFRIDNTIERANLKYFLADLDSGAHRFNVVIFLSGRKDSYLIQQIKINLDRR